VDSGAPAAAGQLDPPAGQSQDAGQLLQAAIAALDGYDTISASLCQQVDVFGKRFTGSGTYVQGPARFNLLRLELKLQSGDQTSNVLQVADGKHFWTSRQVAGQWRIVKVDLQRVAEARAEATAGTTSEPIGLGLGGLPQLLRGLAENFQFTSAQPFQLGQVPATVLTGHWRPERLVPQMPDQRERLSHGEPPDLAHLPEHLPDQVLLFLGRDDRFPYRVEFRRHATSGSALKHATPAAADRTLATLELFQIQVNHPIDPLQFVYTPDSVNLVDETERFLPAKSSVVGGSR
jgi:hypothetical protein